MPGLEYYKLDLHTHTPASKCYLYDHSPDEIVESALKQGLKAIAVTDHNTAEWIDLIKDAASGTGLTVFPGVEISMSGGFHIVAIYDSTVDRKYVENFLGAIRIKSASYGKQGALCNESPSYVINTIHEYDGLAILAHIDAPKGAFYQQVGIDKATGHIKQIPQECCAFFNELPYDAVECVNGQLPEKFDKAHGFKKFPPVYQASDNPDPKDPKKHSLAGIAKAYSWFCMDQINLEGLRQCFVDPEVRIILQHDYEAVSYPQITSMCIDDGCFFIKPQFSFHKGLNCIVGGKGVGKSLAIEFLRFALGQPSSDPNITKDHVGKLDTWLGKGRRIEVVYQLENGTKYRIIRTYEGSKPSKDGLSYGATECKNLDSNQPFQGDIAKMFPILAYSQTEVIKIAEDKEAQLKLIDRFIDTQPFELQIADLETQLQENDKVLAKALDAKARLDELEYLINTLNEQIGNIDKVLADPIFDSVKKGELKKKVFETQMRYIQNHIDEVDECKAQISALTLEDIPQDWQDDESLKAQQDIAVSSRAIVENALDAARKKLMANNDIVGKALEAWRPDLNKIMVEYTKILQDSGGDQQAKEIERKGFETQKASFEEKRKEYKELTSGLKKINDDRETLLNKFESAYQAYYDVRRLKFEGLTEASGGKLKLSLNHATNRDKYICRLSELLKGGQNAPTPQTRRQVGEKISPRRFIDLLVQRDLESLMNEGDLTEIWAKRILEKLWSHDDFVEVLALQHSYYPEDLPFIQFQKPSGKYAELSALSVGQKCTALLIIALCDAKMPILIDQPEDALDIVSVWQDVAMKLRDSKHARQFILTTHNSSIAVAADSDQFIILEEAGGDRGKVIAAGAIDRPEVRKAVIDRLEGGEKPYGLRSRKYNMPLS